MSNDKGFIFHKNLVEEVENLPNKKSTILNEYKMKFPFRNNHFADMLREKI